MAKNKIESDPSKNTKKKKTRNLLSVQAMISSSNKNHQQRMAKPNPFEIIRPRNKFDVLGRKRKGEERRIGLSRSLAIEKRKKTLQKEYEQSAKSSVFVDKRIGEKDGSLQEYDKAVLRMQRERQLKLRKRSKYNLDDGDENENNSAIRQALSLSEVDDFDEDIPLDDDEDPFVGTQNDSANSKYLNLHAENDTPESTFVDGMENVQKSKKQVMSEIILKSKFYKAQKAKDKEEDDHLMERLDQDFASLAQKEALVSLTQPSKMNALKSLANKSNASLSIKGPSGSASKESLQMDKPDEYDKLVKVMSLDMRARPSDRTKTPEEIAQEERERLEVLEEERRKRMLCNDDSSDENNSDDEDHNSESRKFKAVSGDDLGDSFSVDEEIANKKGWVDDIYEKEDADNPEGSNPSSKDSESDGDDQEGSDGEDGSSDDETTGNELGNLSSLKDWEQSDDDDQSLDAEQADDANETQVVRKTEPVEHIKSSSTGKQALPKQVGLPFVIEAPNNLEELCSLLDGRSDGEVTDAIARIRACNSIRLAAENRRKMQVFYGVLLQYFAVLATERPLSVKRLNSLVKPLIEMSVETPYFAAICARQRLIHIRAKFCEDIRIPEKSSWPSLKTLLLLRLWSLIFPCSDFRHVVMTPAILLMCEYLMRCPVLSGRDVAIGSFLCSMVLSVAKQSQKFCPEALIFLKSLLVSSLEVEPRLQPHSQCHHLMELQTPTPWLLIRGQASEVHPIDFLAVMDMEVDSPLFLSDNFKACILVTVVETLKGFVNVYGKLSSFSEIFLPFLDLLHGVLKNTNLPSLLQEEVRAVINLINTKAREHQMLRQPLQMRKQKPVPIKLLNPKFEESFVKGRDYDPDRERAERKKLKKLLKREAKGAVRELRKDNHFIFGLKEKDRLQQEEERVEKYGKARAFLQEQEHAFKSGQLGRGRKRRR